MKKVNIVLSLISESETHIWYRFITQSEIFRAFISWNFDDYGLQIMRTQNSMSPKIRILHKINKKMIFSTEMSGFWNQYLVGPPFAWIHWRATPFSNDPLWLTLFVEGVNDRFLDHCQVSSLPHYCGFKEQEIPGIYTVWMVIYWNSNVIFWDTDFWPSWTVISNHQN